MDATVSVRDAQGTYRLIPAAALLEGARQYALSYFRSGCRLTSPADTEPYIRTLLAGREHEVFAVLFLDNRHCVLEYKELFRGTIDSTAVYPREVVKEALAKNAAAAIFFHNHPSGITQPSQADILITKTLKAALELVDVRVLDHLIVGKDVTSMCALGLL